jgi:hypothetical protein
MAGWLHSATRFQDWSSPAKPVAPGIGMMVSAASTATVCECLWRWRRRRDYGLDLDHRYHHGTDEHRLVHGQTRSVQRAMLQRAWPGPTVRFKPTTPPFVPLSKMRRTAQMNP